MARHYGRASRGVNKRLGLYLVIGFAFGACFGYMFMGAMTTV